MSDRNLKPTEVDRQAEMDVSRADDSMEIKNEESDESMRTVESEALVKLESLDSTETSRNIYDSQFDVFEHALSSQSGEMNPLVVKSDCSSERGTAPAWVQQELAFDKSGASLKRELEQETEQGTDDYVNYGSDDDSASDDDDEEPLIPVFIPRVDRALYFDDDDDDDDSDRREQTEEPAASPQDYLPKDLFHYDWVNFSSPAPAERRETFRAGEIGPTSVFPTPYETFTAIWTPEFMQTIALETNRYAQQTTELRIRDGTLGPCSRLTRWQDTDVDELYVYFALLLATGACVKSNAKEYWTNDDVTATPGFAQYMSYNRYLLLSSCLHFVDNKTNARTMSRSKARVFKIQPVIQHLNDRFQALYTLGRNIAVDESLTQWKGWLAFRQFIKSKAAGVGVKTYELCDSRTGYLWRFKVYTGRDERDMEMEVTPRSEYIVSLVLELLKGLEDKGYTVWMDNFYNSPALARVMKSLGFDCAGTLRTNRRFVPPQIRSKTAKDMVLGEVTGCTSGDVDILLWRDTRRVAMISTYHGAGVTTTRKKSKPNVEHDYNMCMGGVDKKDLMLSAYPIERKHSRIWYKKLFRRLLNVSVLNAYILHRDCAVPNIHPHIRKHRAFRKALVAQMLGRHHHNGNTIVPAIKITRKVVLPPTAIDHFPKQYGFVSNSTKKGRIRRTCVVCHKRQTTYCEACNVPLCLEKCIITYHS